MIGLLLALLLVAVGGLLVWRLWNRYTEDQELTTGETVKLAIAVLLILSGGVVTFISFTTVDVGHAKLIVDPLFTKSISKPIVGPSWTFRPPWTYAIDIYYATTSTEMWTDAEAGTQGEYPAIHVLSKDGLDIEVDILIRYQLDPKSLVDVYRSFPDLRWEDRAISSIVREDVRDVISQFTAIEIIEQREALSTIMTNTIFNSLVTEPSLHQGLVENTIEIDLRDVDPTSKFKQAVEAKLTAEQEKIQAEFERSRKLIQANATAQAAILEAEGEGRAILIKAELTAEALERVLSTIMETANVTGTDAWNTYFTMQSLKEMSKNVGMLIIGLNEEGVPIIVQSPTP